MNNAAKNMICYYIKGFNSEQFSSIIIGFINSNETLKSYGLHLDLDPVNKIDYNYNTYRRL